MEDFLSVDLGKAIIQNSSVQILLKQSSAAIEKVANVFYLSEGEQHLLLSADIGEGLFFAGPAHAAIRVISSPEEHALATTKPQEVAAQERSGAAPVKIEAQVPAPNMPVPRMVTEEQKPARPTFTVEPVTNK